MLRRSFGSVLVVAVSSGMITVEQGCHVTRHSRSRSELRIEGRGEKNGVEQLPDAESCPGF